MGTLTTTGRGNLFDMMKLKAPDGAALEVANTLVETNDMIMDFPNLPSNGGMTHHGVRTAALPSGTLTTIGGTWGSSKSERTPFVEDLAIVRSRYECPVDTLAVERKEVSQALVDAEDFDHIEGLGQSMINLIISGPTNPDQKALKGLMNKAPWNAIDNEFCYDVGGTTNLRSAWLACPDVNTVHFVHNPHHPTLGVVREDKGDVFIQATITDGIVTAGRWDIIIEYELIQGIVIRDQRALKRIANVPCGSTDTPTADLVNMVIRASLKHNIKKSKPWFLYCDADLYTQLVLGANDKLKVFMSDKNIYQTVLPMIGTNVIIRRMDALNYAVGSGETEVA